MPNPMHKSQLFRLRSVIFRVVLSIYFPLSLYVVAHPSFEASFKNMLAFSQMARRFGFPPNGFEADYQRSHLTQFTAA